MISDFPPSALRRAQGGTPWRTQAVGLAEPHHPSEEPAVAVAYALLCGTMVAQGRFGEAGHWLKLAEQILQPEAEPDTGADRAGYADLISAILDLLAQPGKPAPGSGAGRARGRRRGWGAGRPPEPLTEGETRVLHYLPTHLRATEIAGELHLSSNTIKTHLRHLYQKLGAHSRREAVERARAFGLLASSP
jgi:DNA-binding CsgD family transcriptional regulator